MAQNMGACKPDRAEKAVKMGVVMSLGTAVALFALINIFPAAVTRIFDNTPDVVSECTRYIHIVSVSYLFMAPMTVYNNLAIGVGKSTRSMLNSITDSLFVRLPLCWILMKPCGLGLVGIYIGMALSPIVAVVMGWHYFHFGQWKEIEIFKSGQQDER